METMYSLYDAETTRNAKALAGRFGLLESVVNKQDICLGTGNGNLCVVYRLRQQILKSRLSVHGSVQDCSALLIFGIPPVTIRLAPNLPVLQTA